MGFFSWTGFAFIVPSRYVKPEYEWRWFSILRFNERFEWQEDGLGGLMDVVQDPSTTRDSGIGDCEDYAVLIASYLLSETEKDVSFVFCVRGTTLHVVCSTGGEVYSNGTIHRGSIRDYCEETGYRKVLTRTVR